jgi:single-strand DNA-binding protein
LRRETGTATNDEIMAYDLEGTLKEIYETKSFGTKGFTKREFVVTVSNGPEDKWPQHVKLVAVKDHCQKLDLFRPGQRVKVSFDLRGSEWQGKYFTDLQAFRIEEQRGGGGAAPGPDNFDEPPPGYGDAFQAGDDIPF